MCSVLTEKLMVPLGIKYPISVYYVKRSAVTLQCFGITVESSREKKKKVILLQLNRSYNIILCFKKDIDLHAARILPIRFLTGDLSCSKIWHLL